MPPTRTSPEWQAEYDERLGLLCGDGVPTREQEALARQQADEKMTELEILERLERIHELARDRRREWAQRHGTGTRNPHND